MQRLVFTLIAALAALILLGFAFVIVTDAPVAQTEIVKTLPAPTSR